jgi:uncharacterized membrane protein YtjA (UPF0391 family)
MLRWSLAFFLVALVAALFGFTGLASDAAGVAQILFFLFLVFFLLSFMTGLFRGRRHRLLVIRLRDHRRT